MKPLNVLIVDDDSLVSDVIQSELESVGHTVIGRASDGNQAVEMAMSLNPDLVLMDIAMPEVDGLEATRRIQQYCPRPVVLLTAHDCVDLIGKAGELGASSYLLKPPRASELSRTMEIARARFEDWSAMQRMNQSLNEAKQFAEGVISSMQDGFIVIDNAGTHRTINDAFCRMTGFSKDELFGIGMPYPYWPQSKSALIEQEMKRAMKGEAADMDFTFMRKDGTLFPAEVALAPVKARDESQPSYCFTIKDLTERKRSEDQIRQALRMQGIQHLAAGIAHEFNNILAGQIMSLELMRPSGGEGSEEHELIQCMKDGCQRAAGLVKQIMALSGQSLMQPQPLNLLSCISNHLENLRELVGERISLKLTCAKAISDVKADPALIHRVLECLCENAQNAMKNGGLLTLDLVEVEIGLDQAKGQSNVRSGQYIRLSVADTGCGMDCHTLQNIFDPFFTTRNVGEGHGLGLPVVQGIVHQHNGWVEVESKIGVGTTFRVFLPILKPSPKSSAIATMDKPANRSGAILLVEDEPMLRELTRKCLVKQGYRVLEAATGEEALAVWKANSLEIELIYTDMMMPGELTGLQVVQYLLAENPRLKAIITTGYDATLIKLDKSLERTIVLLPKPCPIQVLLGTINQCFKV